MNNGILLSNELENTISAVINRSVENAFKKNVQSDNLKAWFTLKEASQYAGVSYNTFIKFRYIGLKICEIEGIKRVSRKEIDRFLEEHSF